MKKQMSALDGGSVKCDLAFCDQQPARNTHGTQPADCPGHRSWWSHLKNYFWSLLSVFVNRAASLFSTNLRADHQIHTVDNLSSEGSSLLSPEVLRRGSSSEELVETYRDRIIVSADAATTTDLGDSNVISLSPTLLSDSASEHHGLLNQDRFLDRTLGLDPLSIHLSDSEQDTFVKATVHGDTLEVNYDNRLNCTQPTSYTLLTACYVDSQNGLIDVQTRDDIVRKILNSVIPRNLSDSSEVFVKPHIRKMYAWTNPEKNFPSELESNTNDKSKTVEVAATVDVASLNASSTSFSPLSPSTEESSTPMKDFCQAPDDSPELHLPLDIDKHGNTLAWAMSNMQITTSRCPDLPTFEDVEKMDRTRADSPSSSSNRPSRDKSVVNTINSSRMTEPTSLATFTPTDDICLATSLYDCDAETIKPKRSSSLKSHHTPPCTPKAVRFADAFGLDLTTVKHVFDLETPPKIPASATVDLDLDTDESIAKIGAKQFGLCFAQPGSAPNFIHRVFNKNVCLEDARVDMPRGLLTGTVRVRSLGFEKRVYVRITYNNWITFFDTLAGYVQGSHDGATDRFSFSVVFPDTMSPGDKAQFAVRYEAHSGEQFWDNNHGQNYSVTCYAKATDLAGDGSWMHYL